MSSRDSLRKFGPICFLIQGHLVASRSLSLKPITFPFHISVCILWERGIICRQRSMILKPKLEKITRKWINENTFLKVYCVVTMRKRDILPFCLLIYFKFQALLCDKNGSSHLTAGLGFAAHCVQKRRLYFMNGIGIFSSFILCEILMETWFFCC